jgi:hypothetical protein
MATYNITVTVPSSSTGTWLFSVDGGPNQTGCVNLANVPYNESITFQLTLQPEIPGDTVAFSNTATAPPLQFVGWRGQNLNNPMWYTLPPSLTVNDTVLTFTDDSLNVDERTYIFKINALYNNTLETSPDPTIINAGTGGTDPTWIEEKVEVRVTETLV